MKNLILVVILGFSLSAFGQEGDQWKLYPGADTSKQMTAPDNGKIKSFDLNFNAKPGEAKVVKDERITNLTTWVGTPQKGGTVQLKGYRVQLIFDSDKDLVNAKRAEYLGQHSKNPAYVDYLQPNFRLRVGNFRTRLQAEEWAHEISTSFPDAVIVEDWIELPELKKAEEKK